MVVAKQNKNLMTTHIKGGTIVNEGECHKADIIIEGDRIKEICIEGADATSRSFDVVIDASGCYILPGIIDTHVHFREPGLTHKACMQSESRAAACGGVTSVFDMPNTKPQTTSADALQEKHLLAAAGRMHVNYTFFPGATNNNQEWLRSLDTSTVPGIKLFMGSSTGNMLVEELDVLHDIFSIAHEKHLPLMTHCEDTAIINRNMRRYKDMLHADDIPIDYHPAIRSEEACVKSSALAIALARQHHTQLHIAHVTTARELSLPTPADTNVTMEATVAHLLFTDADYASLGAKIKCNPAVKTATDRDALRHAISLPDSAIHTIGTDHAPHTIEEKQGGAAKAMSGMPMVQFSLVSMLQLVDEGILTMPRMVQLMAHNPATLFSVIDRGFLREGYKADITIVRRDAQPWTVTNACIQSKCRWSPVEGRQYHWQVQQTIINGNVVVDHGIFNPDIHGEALRFAH